MKRLTLSDLKKRGLELTREETNWLLPKISQHSQHHPEHGIVFTGEDPGEDDSSLDEDLDQITGSDFENAADNTEGTAAAKSQPPAKNFELANENSNVNNVVPVDDKPVKPNTASLMATTNKQPKAAAPVESAYMRKKREAAEAATKGNL
ncbi:hypothetical protein PQ469_05960 [Mucilaginibacter sp. KACC 22773]|uniref:hypothetical protein n=1 Tax=Mucilaginibacter sp. KACC 22773 TaxID=3025671 RepID=UPI00236553C1|nr:hypothetical protein [Mucilaginibacter sp. KACC 22773]WDF79547.1 hypothetical protein PQ469_05960 [Mucilaginibacter sp. KACC 22773]